MCPPRTSQQGAPASKRLDQNQTLHENQDAILVPAGGQHYECFLRLHPYPGGNDGLQSFVGGRSETASAPTPFRFGPAVWPCGSGSRGESRLFRSDWKLGHALPEQSRFPVRPGYPVLRQHASFHWQLTSCSPPGNWLRTMMALRARLAWTTSFAN